MLGGAGKAGLPFVQEALASGYQVKVLLRHPDQFDFSHEQLEIVKGDARDPDLLKTLLRGCDALVSTLGHPKGESTPITASVTRLLLSALSDLNLKRYIVVTSLLDTGTEKLDAHTRQATQYMQTHFPAFMKDRQLEFKLLTESLLDWTYVRVPFIVPEPATGRVLTNLNHLPGQTIHAGDLARFLTDQLSDDQFIRKAPYVSSGLA